MGELDVRLLLRLLREGRVADGVLDRLLELYRAWFRGNGTTLSSEREPDPRSARIVPFSGPQRP